ncbi:MAG: tetratricopeptide repeat protein [Verrucomicrobia bacterium]|nr:tetratricopeptide repeat protein [Verrucomicrobiota bacterium]
MSPRPAIFISAVSRELKSARQLVANTLIFLGYEPDWQDIFGIEEGDLRAMLRRRIDACTGVVQLVGNCYGAEPPISDEQFGRVSYTQYEALYAKSKGKKVWYLFLDDTFPADPHEDHDQEKRELQAVYRARVKADCHLYHPLGSREGLEAAVLKLRDDLVRLRRGVKRWAISVAVLMALTVALCIWLLQGQQRSSEEQRQTNQQLQALKETVDKLQQGVYSFAEVQNKVRQEKPGQKPGEIDQRTYEELSKKLGIDMATLKEKLPRFAEELQKAPNASTYERANAAYVSKDYNEAERLALAAADEAQRGDPPNSTEAVRALELAAWAAEKRIEYADALKRLRDAEKLTDRTRDPAEWCRVQFAIAWVLHDQGRYGDAEHILREVLAERERTLGPEHPDTLATRHYLASALFFQGKYGEAETEYRAVLKLREKALGAEHPDTLRTRNNLALALAYQAKYGEAEAEYRALLKLKEKVLGPEHSSTLITRNGLADALDNEGKYGEAETEYRALVKLKEKVDGPENPDTLGTRNNLANTLTHEGKYAEAEAEYRAVLQLEEKVLGSEHPNTLVVQQNLAEALLKEGRYAEAETEYRDVLKLEQKVLGAEHPETLLTRNGLGSVLDVEGRCAEAEKEDRAVLALDEKVLGSEHPDTLTTRNNLANALLDQGNYAEAETEYRAVLVLKEKVLGPEHPDTLRTCFDLARCLRAKSELRGAAPFAERAVDGARKVLGLEHPDTKQYEQLLHELVAKED